MTDTAESLPRQLDSIRIDADGIAEIDGGNAVVSIPWAQLSRLALRRGAGAERPVVVFLLGVALSLAGAYFLLGLLQFLLFGGKYLMAGAWLVALLPMGLVMLWSLRPRYVLVATTTTGTRKLIFQSCGDRAAIERFLEESPATVIVSGD
jgi:hypothetical protein